MTHVLGWLTVASQIGLAGFVLRWLSVASRESRTWMRRVPVPRYALVPPSDNSTNYVGYV